ncbi:hypothetical protein [Roseimaritima ulvae]|uniref:Uncharacterized protein n=1 Tax=Roseimaritima ulvae TaxID=980254 RepID=A0A5B9R0A9_9BACT|nr:hypothetical protein [Roseimaritima ulvae]QEG39701.1 hypothetical protein UC8_16990 [Roseimaritima ulvae]
MNRIERIRQLCGHGSLEQAGGAEPYQQVATWHAIVCSRLGRSLERRRRTFDYLQQAVLKTKRDGAALLVVAGTAPEPWVRRAAELFHVPLQVLEATEPHSRDRLLVGAADRVFAVWVRRRGKIAELLGRRLAVCGDESTWVAVNEDADCAARSLIARGAVGWYLPEPDLQGSAVPATGDRAAILKAQAVDWTQYLVHCTRGRGGPLPGQSEAQYHDEVLLGGEGGRPATAAETLRKILASGWLLGAARVSRREFPVVCWSEVPLPKCLARRIFRPHLGRWDYEPFGLAVRKSAAQRLGIQPVIYGTAAERERLPVDQRWRFQAQGTRVDWRNEKEWRCRGSLDLSRVSADEALVFVGEPGAVAATAAVSPWPVVDVATFLCSAKGVQ